MTHGGDIYRNQVKMDFSVNTNPLGMPERVKQALMRAVEESGNYPDIRAEALVAAVADWGGFRREMLVFGNGASELLLAAVHAVRPEKILIPTPSFFGYEKAAEAAGCEVVYWEMKPEEKFCLTENFLDCLTADVDMVFLANPNNPVGNLLQPELLEKIAEKCLTNHCFLVLDECFIELTGKEKTYSFVAKLGRYPNVLVLRAFTKLFAIPGVRLGYVVCGEELAEKIRKQLPEWNLSVYAQKAGVAATEEKGFAERSAAYVAKERAYLTEVLEKEGFSVYPGEADYLLFSVEGYGGSGERKPGKYLRDGNQEKPGREFLGVGKENVQRDFQDGKQGETEKTLYELLLERGILIRDCSNFRGLSQGFYRIAVKSAGENRRFAEVLHDVMSASEKKALARPAAPDVRWTSAWHRPERSVDSECGSSQVPVQDKMEIEFPQMEYVLPGDIEKRSFEIISEELAERGITLPEENALVIKRVIHTSADFSYADTMTFSENAVSVAKQLLLQGADIVTDTNMALSGINKKVLHSLGGEAHCFMADESVAKEAKERQMTRAAVSMERAAELGKPVVFVVGNAPTALVKLYEMVKENRFSPAFIIGVPVGFVNVEAAKEMILTTEVPYIINRGRKGGSNVAAAICNAILYSL